MIRKRALQTGAYALFALIAWNAYLAITHLSQTQKIAGQTLESATIQAEISSVLRDLTDMETGQRGFLLTANAAYLQPYNDAKSRMGGDFASLRESLSNRPDHERVMESQLESLADSKEAEIQHAINLRQQGYRHRAFKLVDSNEGMEYMDKARSLLSALSAAESSRFAKLDAEKSTRLRKAFEQIILGNLCLLALAACLVKGIRKYGRRLEKDAAQSRQELILRDLQLRKLTSALSTQALAKTSAIEQNACLLLENYGGFLPRQGHEYAEQIKSASEQMERLRQELVGEPDSRNNDSAEAESVKSNDPMNNEAPVQYECVA